MRPVRREHASHAWGTLAFIAALGSAGHARAQAPAGSAAKVAAETLFEEGRRLMNEGKGADACPKFAESQRLDPSPSTLINLASCYEKTDHPATAWATYREGASAASAAGRQDLVATAQRHANALFPTLPRLSLSVATPVDGTIVALDGVSVGRAQWGLAVPVDPGEHTVEASAPHFKPWSSKLVVGKEATTIAVSVPALEAAPAEPTPSPAAASGLVPSATSPASSPPAADSTPENASRGSTQRIAGIVIGAAGVVSVAVGAGFVVNAKSQYDSSLKNGCTGTPPDQCAQPGFDQRNSALSSGNIATVLLVGGGIAAAFGAVLWLTAPSASHPQGATLALVPGLGGGMLRGTW